jgi:hypothetical protein
MEVEHQPGPSKERIGGSKLAFNAVHSLLSDKTVFTFSRLRSPSSPNEFVRCTVTVSYGVSFNASGEYFIPKIF